MTARISCSCATPREPNGQQLTDIFEYSLACRYHPRPRRRTGHRCYLLPLDLAATPQDLHSVLGLLSSIRRGSSHHDQQVQHLLAGRSHRHDHHGTNYCCRSFLGAQRHAVSLLCPQQLAFCSPPTVNDPDPSLTAPKGTLLQPLPCGVARVTCIVRML